MQHHVSIFLVTFSVEAAIAVIMALLSMLVLTIIASLALRSRNKKEKTVKASESDFTHCELNDIMGYEFIQIRNMKGPSGGRAMPTLEDLAAQDTEREATALRTVGDRSEEKDEEYYQEKWKKARELANKEKQQQEKEEEEEEEKVFLSNDQMAILSQDWPENVHSKDDEDLLNQMYPDWGEAEYDMNDYEEQADDMPDGEPQQPDEYDEIMRSTYEKMDQMDKIYETMFNLSKEDEEKLRKANSLMMEETQPPDDTHNQTVDKDDLPET